MAVSRATLIVRYPEFTDTPTALVDACIVDAELMIDRAVFGNKGDMAVTAYAGHLIATNPLGEMARIDKKSDRTVYSDHYERIKRTMASGFRVI